MNKSENYTEEPGWLEATSAEYFSGYKEQAAQVSRLATSLILAQYKTRNKKNYITDFYSHFHMSFKTNWIEIFVLMLYSSLLLKEAVLTFPDCSH